MSAYNFGYNFGAVGTEVFNDIVTSYQSDIEQSNSTLSVYNPESPELATARALAEEMINLSGADIKLYLRTDNEDFDAVWDEDPDPTYWNMVSIKAFFKPTPIEAELKQWGAESNNKTVVVFSYKNLYDLFGDRMLRVGDVVILPYNAAKNDLTPSTYRITNATPAGNYRYFWLYFECTVESITADVNVRPEQDVQGDDPNRGTFYESH
jgi:hypothetical protein